VIAHAQKPDFIFWRNGRVHLNRQGRQFSRLLAAEVCASAVVMLDTSRSDVTWRVLSIHSIRQFPLHFPSRALSCAITFQLDSTSVFPNASSRFSLMFKLYHLTTKTTRKIYTEMKDSKFPRTLSIHCRFLGSNFMTSLPQRRIWGSHSAAVEVSSLLGCYTESNGKQLVMCHRTLLPSSLWSSRPNLGSMRPN